MLGSATKLQTARTINGTSFNGTGNITTSKWGTSRKITISGAVSGNVNVDGSGDVTITTTQANIAVLTANVKTPEAGSSIINALAQINYPQGYNQDNCVIVSLMSWNKTFTTKFWSSLGATQSAAEMGCYGLRGTLRPDNIEVQVHKIDPAESAKNVTIKIVLMKVS